MLDILYNKIGEIFGENVEVDNLSPFDRFMDFYIFKKERDIDKIFKKITDIKFEKQNYELNKYNNDFYYRACSWIISISKSEKKDSEKIEIIRNATYILINNINTQNKIFSILEKIGELTGNNKIIKKSNGELYFSDDLLIQLKEIKNTEFELLKLIKIIEEINFSYSNDFYLSVASLLRMLIDHIPPIFGFKSFAEVVASYKFSKSDKKNMEHLLGGLKNISDGILHNQISNHEVLPTKNTIEFRADFDILIKNIILRLK